MRLTPGRSTCSDIDMDAIGKSAAIHRGTVITHKYMEELIEAEFSQHLFSHRKLSIFYCIRVAGYKAHKALCAIENAP